jgi:RNA polymerase sigma-70 factor (ECF subfamily)
MQIIKSIQIEGAKGFPGRSGTFNHTVEQVIAAVDDVVASAQAGSADAFEELYSIYSGRLYRTILSITNHPHDAEEALQDTFLRAYSAINKFEGKSTIYSWLTRIAINSALMILRRRRARPEVLFDPRPDDRSEAIPFEVKDSAPNPEDLCVLNQHRYRTLRAIHRLNPRLRTPLRMQIMHGWSVREISRALNITEAAVKSRLSRARQQLFTLQSDRGIAPPSARLIGSTRANR